ncbi:DUF3558 domain-containing protein [Amycolatopsis sp. K13G38]|uniref:DUF3558 domain-containing protein n=1 Tax=Amycolatopsis acididurans TaxID=2724524 RepID=A0ABX1JIS4_9PSEU|nr:DUF3558 domain-containing protein [Amycolatopsis acididurans]NKQ58147.1 DUF3558 domain-containing protein [Amycolatopsis acididurans]
MTRRFGVFFALVCASAGLLTACAGGKVGGTPSPTTGAMQASSGAAPSSGTGAADVPQVQTPLPATALDGSPCDSALTTEQVVSFIGSPKAPDRQDDFDTGPACTWFSADGVSGQIGVYYETKIGGGMNVIYRNLKPKSGRWEPTTLQGYPAVAGTFKGEDQSITGRCDVTVGIRDDLVFAVGLTLGDNARKRGVDSCEGAKDVANTVLTNLKGRA